LSFLSTNKSSSSLLSTLTSLTDSKEEEKTIHWQLYACLSTINEKKYVRLLILES